MTGPLQFASLTAEVPLQRAEQAKPPNECLIRKPPDKADFRNIKLASRIVKAMYGVQMKYRRRNAWDCWKVVYAGPKEELEEARVIGEDIMCNPYNYGDPNEDQREFASVTKW